MTKGRKRRKPTRRKARAGAKSGSRNRQVHRDADRSSEAKRIEVAEVDDTTSPQVAVVAIGASAGGLEAFSQLLDALGEAPGLALVFIQHLAPQHESALPALLSGRTHMPVIQVREGTHVEANHVYVIPPNAQMEIRDGDLHLNPRPEDRSQYTPIDFFLRSLAETAQSGAIGVILSGSSSDGAVGLREIKAVGGITIAQDPETARYDGMPRAAIATDAVDLVLSPADIAAEILRIGRHPYVKRVVQPRHSGEEFTIDDGELRRLMTTLRNASGIDFTHYKSPTIKRRLQRRMVLQKMSDVEKYLRYLKENPQEAQKLTQDILIHVTRFFREPESFAALTEHVFPEVVANQHGESPIRIWVPGCSTGEEAYSVAIAMIEYLGDQRDATPIQVFGTDVSEAAIDCARAGRYPESISADVSAERLHRFFSKTDGSYRISKPVRDLCVFARQDLTRDPPYSKLDLIVCRNVLIYLGTVLQKRLLNVFHYAVNAKGFLMLGHAETTGPENELFRLTDKTSRIYRKNPNAPPNDPLPLDFAASRAMPKGGRVVEPRSGPSIQSEVQRLLLDRFAPPGVVVDGDLRIVQFLGHTGRFLEPAPGEAHLTLPKMVRDGLLNGLRIAFHQARREGRPVRRRGLHVRSNGHDLETALEVIPVGDSHYLVLFQQEAAAKVTQPPARKAGSRPKRAARKDPRMARLEQELSASRDYLQSIIQDLEAANEELQSANEEILSSNEELQSTNEELDTAKEELQSTNEELNTVNEELHGRNEELSRVNSDLVNLLGSVQIAVVIVENDLRIRRFTPMAERVLNLIPGDVGRPISHIQPNIECQGLEELIRGVVESVTPQERTVQDRKGRWFSLHVRPYKNVDNRIDGAVLVLFDIDAAKRHEAEMQSSRDYAEAILETVGEALVVLDADLRVQTVNKAFCEAFRVTGADSAGRLIYEIGNGQWNIPELRERLGGILANDLTVDGFEVEHEFPSIGRRTMHLTARRIERADGSPELILLTIRDAVRGREAARA
jgi:two-component system, chemotaxis family, CheB/CheR fusion protein